MNNRIVIITFIIIISYGNNDNDNIYLMKAMSPLPVTKYILEKSLYIRYFD